VRYQTAERLAEAFGDALQVARGAETLPSQPALAPPAGRVRVVPGVSEEVLPGPLPELPPATQPARARWRGRDRAFGELARRLVPWRLRLPALRRRLIAAPVLAVALLYAASQLAAAPRARTSHPPHASGVKRAVASAGTHLTTAAKAPTPPAHRRVTPHQRTRRTQANAPASSILLRARRAVVQEPRPKRTRRTPPRTPRTQHRRSARPTPHRAPHRGQALRPPALVGRAAAPPSGRDIRRADDPAPRSRVPATRAVPSET
jgi:hypothetical protein